MGDFLLIMSGGVLFIVLDWVRRFWTNTETKRRQNEAKHVLSKYGLSTHLYLPTIGVEDKTLWAALDEFSFTGRLVTDENGFVIGGLLHTDKNERRLKLVVDNTLGQ